MNNYQYFIVRCSLLFVAFMKFFRFKILFLFFILAVFGLPEIFSQTSDTATKVVTVLSPQNFYLDSRFISNINGRSRLAIPIKRISPPTLSGDAYFRGHTDWFRPRHNQPE